MIHLNGNLLCAIDTETTGLDPTQNEIYQFACLPLAFNLDPHPKIIPFDVLIRPTNIDTVDPDALKLNKSNLAKIINEGVDPSIAAMLFDDWFAELPLAEGKRISPLGQNWAFDYPFIREWLGPVNCARMIDGRYRDTMSTAAFINDAADFRTDPCPLPKQNLRYMAMQLGISWEDGLAHNALYDCLKTAEVYREMVKQHGKPVNL